MAQNTTRDRVWTVALKRTHRDAGVIDSDVLSEICGCTERTARDVLKTMAHNDILLIREKGVKTTYVGNPEMF